MSMQPISTFYIFGTTCAGKDTLIEYSLNRHPELVGTVQVGKIQVEALTSVMPNCLWIGIGQFKHKAKRKA